MASNTPCGVESSGLAAAAVAAHTQITAASRPIQVKKDPFRFNCACISSFVCNSCFVILAASLLDSPQEKSGPKECDHRPSQKNHEIANIKLQTRAVHVHQSKSATKMCKRKQLRDVTNSLRQLFEWRKRPR